MINIRRRGVLRLTIALVVPWLIGWASIYIFSSHQVKLLESKEWRDSACLQVGYNCDALEIAIDEEAARQSGVPRQQLQREQVESEVKLLQQAEHWTAIAPWWGVLGPVVLGLLAAISLWVWRGFEAPQNSN